MKKDRTLDCFGLLCPMPIVKTAQKIREMKKGEVLEVIADDEGIRHDMPAWCGSTGNEFLGVEEDRKEGLLRVYVRKTRD